MCPNTAGRVANSVDHDVRQRLIWVCTICSDVSVSIPKVIKVLKKAYHCKHSRPSSKCHNLGHAMRKRVFSHFQTADFHQTWPIDYKSFSMLNSGEHEFLSANKYENANKIWHFHIY